MEFATVSVRWSAPIPTEGADASPIPRRGGVYELLYQDHGGVERLYAGQTEDLRRAMISRVTFFRYWECEVHRRRLEVVAALVDSHLYDCGHDEVEEVACVQLAETH